MNKKKIMAMLVSATIVISGLFISTKEVKADTSSAAQIGVSYQAHVQGIGWQSAVLDGAEAGTDGKSLRLEALKINLVNAPAGAKINYQAHVQGYGWQSWVSDGAEAGTDHKSLRAEAIRISLENLPGYSIQYRAHIQGYGWQPWVSDGDIAGTTGKSLRLEAVEIKIVKTNTQTFTGYITTEDDFAAGLHEDTAFMIDMKMMALSGLGITFQQDGKWVFYYVDGNIATNNTNGTGGKWTFDGTGSQLNAWNIVEAQVKENNGANKMKPVPVTVIGTLNGNTQTNPGPDADGQNFQVITVNFIAKN